MLYIASTLLLVKKDQQLPTWSKF